MKALYKKILSIELQYILVWFFVTRLVLELVAVWARLNIRMPNSFVYSKHIWLAIWGVWDSGWYIPLAKYGYSNILSDKPETLLQANYAFFPLYPLLMNLLEKIVSDYYVAGLIISNIALIVALVYLYKLVELDFGHLVARKSVKYLLLFPVAFIFSGVFTEALFLALAVAAFYYAKKDKWLIAGILGFFLALTRSIGFLIFIPLLIEYLYRINFDYRKIKLNSLFLLLPPIGLSLFSLYNYYLTSNPFAFLEIQSSWGRQLTNPIRVLLGAFFSGDYNAIFSAIFVLVFASLIIYSYKKLPVPYLVFAGYSILIPLFSGLESIARYTLIVFPIYIALAILAKGKNADLVMTVALFVFQCILMIFWTTGFDLIK